MTATFIYQLLRNGKITDDASLIGRGARRRRTR
jgi:hypothetical protein